MTNTSVTIDRSVLVEFFAHAASAARIVGHLDNALAVGPLGDHVDALAHGLGELLGAPRAVPVPTNFDDEPTAFSLLASGERGDR